MLLKKIERGQSCLRLSDFSMIKRFVSTKPLRSKSVSETENVSAVRSGDLYVDHRIGPRLSQVCPQKVAHIYNEMSEAMKRMSIRNFKIALDQSTILDQHCPSGKILSDKVQKGVLYSRFKAWRIKKWQIETLAKNKDELLGNKGQCADLNYEYCQDAEYSFSSNEDPFEKGYHQNPH